MRVRCHMGTHVNRFVMITDELPPQTRVRLSCGHTGAVWTASPRLGVWVSCWAVVATGGGKPQDGCQAQRKIVEILRDQKANK